MPRDERTYAEIDVDSVLFNLDFFKAKNPGKKIFAVMKADSYGHGDILCKYIEHKIDGLCSATIEEGIRLRQFSDKPILILGYIPVRMYHALIEYNLTPSVYSCESATLLNEYFSSVNSSIAVHLKINTGMNRMGIRYSDFLTLSRVLSLDRLKITGIYSHLASNDDIEFTRLQKQRFLSCVQYCNRLTDGIEFIHIANSADSASGSDIGNAVRVGYGMYGYGDPSLKNALSWKARVIKTDYLKENETIGYGRTFRTFKPLTKTAVLSVGYGDGYPRDLPGKRFVLYKGMKLPILGRICMDMTVIDVSDADINPGDYVTLLGTSEGITVSAENLGFGYEVLCDISKRVKRIYLKENTYISE